MSEVAGALTPTEHGRLLAAAVQGVAWALIEYETDTSDRGVSEEHYRDAVRRAEAILPALVPGSDAPEPRRICSCWRLRPDGSHGKGCDLHVESSER